MVAVGAAALFLVGAVAVAQGRDDDAEAPAWGGSPVAPPLARPDFTLTDTEGRPFDFRAETEGRLTLLFFGYTNCPDVCPVHMATLSAALETPGMPEPTVVFVTTDPDRDTPERLRQWLDQFDPQFVGLTGTIEEIAAAEAAAQVAGSMVEPAEDGSEPTADGDYNVAHAAQLIAYTPDDQAHVVYPFGVRREDWVNDLPLLMANWGPEAEETGSESSRESSGARS
ncbi:MAG: SCO family protein [Acidimicrobiales bacterium]